MPLNNKSDISLGWANKPPRLIAARVIGFISVMLLVYFWGLNLAEPNPLDWRWTRALFGGLAFIAWVSFLFSLLRLMACLSPKPEAFTPEVLSDDLPHYTVLVPLFNEANMVRGLMQALEAIKYPHAKLQILLICETVDPQTIARVKFHMRAPFELIIVPRGSPQTKPRALNYAMQYARGDFVTIYDAEDRPHPDQLLTALAAFKDKPNWAALQAPLDYFNANQNWLTQQFSLEYAALFHVWLPWLMRLKLPFPLGGTSNHMRRNALDKVGGWDAHNVTEDADLSFRLAAQGYEIGYITPPTQEEAVSRLPDWHFQRARWIKGYIQTWQVHMNAPFAPLGFTGVRRFICLQLTLGITLLSVWFYVPAIIAMATAWLWMMSQGQAIYVQPFYLFSFVFSISTALLIGTVGAVRAGKLHLLKAVIFMPAYWGLLFAPSLRAVWELKRIPFHWHKTEHGIGLGICIFLGITGFRNHFKKHTTIKPHRLPWMLISLAAIATGFMLLVHVVNLFGLETGRNR